MNKKNYTQEKFCEDKRLYKKFWNTPMTPESLKEQLKVYYKRTYGTDDVIKLFGNADLMHYS